MTKIMGSKTFNSYDEAIELYSILDRAGYNVELSGLLDMYSVSYVGYTEVIPMEGIQR